MAGLKVVLLGPPGCGKTTQAIPISEKFGIPHVETGRILREIEERNSDAGNSREDIDHGKLAPEELVNPIVRDRIDPNAGFVLDGYPRHISQAKKLDEICRINVAIHIDVPASQLLTRLLNRQRCGACGAVYNRVSNPPEDGSICDICSGNLTVRRDDKKDTIRHRIDSYRTRAPPMLDYYNDDNLLEPVDGDRDIKEVTSDILALLDRFR